jgi:uncharacterized protein
VTLLEAIAVLAAGFAAGGVNTIVGSGSLITFPTLLAVGFPSVVANVSNSVGLVPGGISGAIGYRRELRGQWRRVGILAIGTTAGAIVGGILLLELPESVFDAVVPILVLLASLTLGAQPRIKRWTSSGERTADNPKVLLPTIFLAAVYGGYFGGALGVVLIAVLSLLAHDTLQRLNAVKVLLSLVTSTVTVVLFALFAPVDWLAVLLLAPTTLVGGYLGMAVAKKLPDGVLRWSVVLLGIGVAIYLFLR